MKTLNFEPGKHVRGVFASFLGADFNRGVKTMIFGLFGGSGAVFVTLGVPRGVKNCKLLNFEPVWHVRGVFASISGTVFNRGVKPLNIGLLGGSGAV